MPDFHTPYLHQSCSCIGPHRTPCSDDPAPPEEPALDYSLSADSEQRFALTPEPSSVAKPSRKPMRWQFVKRLPPRYEDELDTLAEQFIAEQWPLLRRFFQVGDWNRMRYNVFSAGLDTDQPPAGLRHPARNVEATFAYMAQGEHAELAVSLQAAWQALWNDHFGVTGCTRIIRGMAARPPSDE